MFLTSLAKAKLAIWGAMIQAVGAPDLRRSESPMRVGSSIGRRRQFVVQSERCSVPECRNWQTNRTQNPAHFTGRVGSSPTSGTTFGFNDLSEINRFRRTTSDRLGKKCPCRSFSTDAIAAIASLAIPRNCAQANTMSARRDGSVASARYLSPAPSRQNSSVRIPVSGNGRTPSSSRRNGKPAGDESVHSTILKKLTSRRVESGGPFQTRWCGQRYSRLVRRKRRRSESRCSPHRQSESVNRNSDDSEY
jgi:hypothetical protein